MSVVLPETHPEHPYQLIPELCRAFYALGWATGTGGGISIKMGTRYYVAPSGVQKERIQPDDIFVLDEQQNIVQYPRCVDGDSANKKDSEDGRSSDVCVSAAASTAAAAAAVVAVAERNKLRVSECTPLFFNAYRLRNAGACLHTHSQNCVLVSLLCAHEFRISHLEMIKGVLRGDTGRALGYRDTLVVPIIENTDHERDLTSSMADCMQRYPATQAVLVRRHGMYVWGPTWQKAKGMVECLDYLMGLALRMHHLGLPWTHSDDDDDDAEAAAVSHART